MLKIPHYYLDIETTGLDENNDEIITIQYQKISVTTGEPMSPLVILKSWEHGEENIVKEIAALILGDIWGFVPVGNNLTFEFKFLAVKIKKYIGKEINVEFFISRPHIDLKPIMILANGGRFKGCHLVLGKKATGANIPLWYKENRYDLIEDYIKDEAICFLGFASKIQQLLGSKFRGDGDANQ
jgi:hypothetical protein